MIDKANTFSNNKRHLSFLALGDSYTIGESVEEGERWPEQLVRRLRENNISIGTPEIIAKTGWTTSDLLEAIDEKDLAVEFHLVSLLIGVNNQYQGKDLKQYKEEFEILLRKSIALAGNKPSKVVVLSIPDYSVTPFAREKDPEKIAKELQSFNEANKASTRAAGAWHFNITSISRHAGEDRSLLAEDGLHPSGKMYKAWVDLISPQVKTILEKQV